MEHKRYFASFYAQNYFFLSVVVVTIFPLNGRQSSYKSNSLFKHICEPKRFFRIKSFVTRVKELHHHRVCRRQRERLWVVDGWWHKMVADSLLLPSVTSVRYSTLTLYFETKGLVYSSNRERER